MRISVVTAVLNRADTLGAALESLAAQTHGPVEHIVQDGGSTDGTLDILARHPHPDRKVASARDGGIYPALNAGIARAGGAAVGLLHSDDVLAHPEVLAQIAAALGDPGVDGVYGDLEYLAADGSGRVVRRWVAGAYRPEALPRGWMPPHPTLFLRREVFDRHGVYDTGFRIAADYEAMLRWLTAGVRLAYVPEVLVRMRLGGESNRSLGRIWLKSREDLRAMRRHGVGGLGTLLGKNVSKLGQFVPRD